MFFTEVCKCVIKLAPMLANDDAAHLKVKVDIPLVRMIIGYSFTLPQISQVKLNVTQ